MVFRLLGQIVRRGWPFLLAFWIGLFLFARFGAPRWEDYAVDQEFAFLRDDAPSRIGEKMFVKAFPLDQFASTIVLVIERDDKEGKHLERDKKFLDDAVFPALLKIVKKDGGFAFEIDPDAALFGDDNEKDKEPAKPKKRSIVVRIRTPNDVGTGELLISPDNQAMIIVMELTADFLANATWPVISEVESLVDELTKQNKVPPGVKVLVTGSAVMGRDHNVAQVESVKATELLTVILVIVLLVLIYRAPLLAIIPLITVFVAIKISLGILAILARAEWVTVFPGISIYITILAYGAGVDYCIFLTARCKEELDKGLNPPDAVARAVEGVGGALVASAATVICGIAMMMFAEFGKFRQAGLAISLSLVLVLAATLTFSSALVRLAGRWAFWPQRLGRPVSESSKRGWLGGHVLEHIWDVVGAALLRRPAAIWWGSVAVMAPFAIAAIILYNHVSYDMISGLPPSAPSSKGTRALQTHFPAGMLGTTTMLLKIPGVKFDQPEGRAIVEKITESLRARKDELDLNDVRSLTRPFGITPAADRAFADLARLVKAQRADVENEARDRYIAALDGRDKICMRLDLVMTQAPFTRRSIAALSRIEQAISDAIPSDVHAQAQLFVFGVTASVRDLSAATKRDRTRIELLVLAAVLFVLVLLLRGVWVPLYLLASVLFSYYATLGVAFLVFWLIDPQNFAGIDWKVAIFLFTILIAVGEDYNIFLLTRVEEESRELGPVNGITAALTRTGPIISSCGIIMAGTFGSLLAGTLMEMKQLGFSLAFGVLVDTFVVRPILVPAFLIVLARRKERT